MLNPLRRLVCPLLRIAALLGAGATVLANPVVRTEQVEARLIAASTHYQPGQTLDVALQLKLIPHWHTYWRNPGDSGLPTTLKWNLPTGVSASDIHWPAPKRLPTGPLTNFGYENTALHLVKLSIPPNQQGTLVLAAQANWLVCAEVCIPQQARLSLSLPSGKAQASAEAATIQAAWQQVPQPDPKLSALAHIQGNTLNVLVERQGEQAADWPASSRLQYFPFTPNLIENAALQQQGLKGRLARLSIPRVPASTALEAASLGGVVVDEHSGTSFEIAPVLSTTAPELPALAPPPLPASANLPSNLGIALLFAFIGGLILNLMPCVFPVLGIKVMGFARHAHQSPALLRLQGLLFLLGVLASFWVLSLLLLGLRAAGAQLGWGFQLQSPWFVTALAVLFTGLGLNLAGLFEIGTGLQNAGSEHSPGGIKREAFFSGVLASVVATPCTAPFLGASLGYTLSKPPAISLLVFTAMALGVAAPVVALSWMPGLIRRLPRPGPWMETFRQSMAFPMFATVVWLATVLVGQQGADAMAALLGGLLLIALGLWGYGRFGQRQGRWRTGWTLLLLGCLSGTALLWPGAGSGPDKLTGQAASTTARWEPYSAEKLQALRTAGKPVFVDFTATWCISCQVNKRVALNRAAVMAGFDTHGVATLRADWTHYDPEITAALAALGRNAIPVYALYVPGQAQPTLLPEVLTPKLVLEALSVLPRTAAPGSAGLP